MKMMFDVKSWFERTDLCAHTRSRTVLMNSSKISDICDPQTFLLLFFLNRKSPAGGGEIDEMTGSVML